MKILIVDDEKFIRKGIYTILSKNLIGQVDLLEAANGIQALEVTKKENPELIITDISMPGCDGLEFIQELRKTREELVVVILSGYDNFEYAQQAIKYGVREYVMKPIQKTEFVTLIQDLMYDIEKKQTKSQKETERRKKNTKILEQVKREYLLGFLHCPSTKEAEKYLAQLKELGIILTSKLYICAVVQYKITDINETYINFAIKNILDEYFSTAVENQFVINVAYDSGRIVSIFEGDSQDELRELTKRILRKAAQLIRDYYKEKIFVGIGDVAYDSVQIHISLRHALLAADYKIFEEGDILFLFENLQQRMPRYSTTGFVKKLKQTEVNVLEILEDFQKLYKISKSKEGIRALKQEYQEIQEFVKKQIMKAQYTKKRYKLFHECWSFQEIKMEMKEEIKLLNEMENEDGIYNATLMNQIIKFVDNHITEEMDLTLIAEKFQRTPGYISTLFKNYANVGFSVYLTNGRIKIAKRLLTESNVSVQDVSELCGYSNPKYFSVVFKKITNETPTSYREKYKIS